MFGEAGRKEGSATDKKCEKNEVSGGEVKDGDEVTMKVRKIYEKGWRAKTRGKKWRKWEGRRERKVKKGGIEGGRR